MRRRQLERAEPFESGVWVAACAAYGPELETDPTVTPDGKRVSLSFVVSHRAGEAVLMPSRVGVLKNAGAPRR